MYGRTSDPEMGLYPARVELAHASPIVGNFLIPCNLPETASSLWHGLDQRVLESANSMPVLHLKCKPITSGLSAKLST